MDVHTPIAHGEPHLARANGAGSPAPRKLAHLSPDERVARGKAARNKVRAVFTDAGNARSTGRTRSGCWRNRPRAASPN
jgi:hypothetical protein